MTGTIFISTVDGFPIFMVAKRNSGLSCKKKPVFKSCGEALQEVSEGAQTGPSAGPASKNNHILQTSVIALHRQHAGVQTIQATLTFTLKKKIHQTQASALYVIIPAD